MPLPYIGMFDLDVIYQTSDAELLYQVLYKLNEIAKSQNIIIDNFQKVIEWATEQIEKFTKEQLEEWLNDGTLENMILALGNVVKYIDTTDQMIETTNLVSGMTIITKGYYSINDGGGATFNIQSDNAPISIALSNGLYAIPIYKTPFNIRIMGCGEQIHNNESIINTLLNIDNLDIYIPNGTYYVSNTIQMLKNNSLYMQPFATIKISPNVGYLSDLIIHNPQDWSGSGMYKTEGVVISGGIYDGDNKVDNIMSVANSHNLTIKDLKIQNCKIKGLIIGYTGHSNQVNVDNIDIYNYSPITGTTGLQVLYSDNYISNIDMVNMCIAVDNRGDNFYSNIHPWLDSQTLIPGSIAFQTYSTMFLDGCYSDSYLTSFYITGSGRMYINNSRAYWSTGLYDEEFNTTNIPIVFDSYSNELFRFWVNNFWVFNNAYQIRLRRYETYGGSFTNMYVQNGTSVTDTAINGVIPMNFNFGNLLTSDTDITTLDPGVYTNNSGNTFSYLPSGSYGYGLLIVKQGYSIKTYIYIENTDSAKMYFTCFNKPSSTLHTWRTLTPVEG